MMEGLRELSARFPVITDVRGAGLFLGIELVTGEQASYTVNRLRDRGILAGTDGPRHNVIKLRPPLIFSEEDADFFISVLAGILDEDFMRGDF
jgi:4-aminobutyrate aminotransferase-like enzyme